MSEFDLEQKDINNENSENNENNESNENNEKLTEKLCNRFILKISAWFFSRFTIIIVHGMGFTKGNLNE